MFRHRSTETVRHRNVHTFKRLNLLKIAFSFVGCPTPWIFGVFLHIPAFF
jgi:hypothetical protein